MVMNYAQCSPFQASVCNKFHVSYCMSWASLLQPMCWAKLCGGPWATLDWHTPRRRECVLCSGRSCKPTTRSTTSNTNCSNSHSVCSSLVGSHQSQRGKSMQVRYIVDCGLQLAGALRKVNQTIHTHRVHVLMQILEQLYHCMLRAWDPHHACHLSIGFYFHNCSTHWFMPIRELPARFGM